MTTFLIDECVSFLTVKLIQECGFQWEMVGKSILKGKDDETIYKYAQRNNMILVTYDLGFGNIFKYSPSSHHGIIVMRVSDLNSIISGNRFFKVLLNREKSFEKTLFIVNSIKYRKRK